MKKTIRCIIISCVIIIGIPVILIIALYLSCFIPATTHIKTEYGDRFTVRIDSCFLQDDDYTISDDNSAFSCSLSWWTSKSDFHAVCDSPYFRCYQIANDWENAYIIKIKDVGSFDIIYCYFEDWEYMCHRFKGSYGDIILSHLLCDEHLTEIAAPIFFEIYPEKMREITDDLNHENYERLKAYGLTDEMTKDAESLIKKKTLMNQLADEPVSKNDDLYEYTATEYFEQTGFLT